MASNLSYDNGTSLQNNIYNPDVDVPDVRVPDFNHISILEPGFRETESYV